jgi:hypothetical protein
MIKYASVFKPVQMWAYLVLMLIIQRHFLLAGYIRQVVAQLMHSYLIGVNYAKAV